MSLQYSPYIWPLAISAVTAWAVAIYMWRRQVSAPGRWPIVALMVCAGFWSACYAMAFAIPSFAGKYFLLRLLYLGIVPVCTLWLLFALDYAGWSPRGRGFYALLTVEPIAALVMAWTNPHHQLHWSQVEFVSPSDTLATGYGGWFWVHAGYNYILLAVSTVVLIRVLIRTSHLYRRQVASILFGLAAPWAGNALYLSGMSPFGNLDLAPLTFTLAGGVVSWGLFYSKILEILPIARDSFLRSMTDSVIVMDLHHRLAYANLAARNLFGRQLARARGRNLSEAAPTLWRVLDGLEADSRAEVELDRDGEPRVYELSYAPLYDRRRQLLGYLGVLHDITERKATEASLRELKDLAEQASRTKSTFLANMSHEMRTPLNIILGYSQIMAEAGDLPERYRKFVREVEESGSRLLELINEVIDISQLDSGQGGLQSADFDLVELLNDLEIEFAGRCNTRGLDWQMRQEIGERYRFVDRARLRDVIANLLDNAVKFTASGGLAFNMEAREGDHVYFEVSDTGRGIPEARQAAIFEPFEQSGTEIGAGGTGLGLAIASRYVAMMGGELTLQSTEGRGSTFCFELPLAIGQAPAIKLDSVNWSLATGLAEGQEIESLVVDNQPAHREVVAEMLAQIGVEVRRAVNGQEALDVVAEQMPDIIFTELHMPVMDGPEMLRLLDNAYGRKLAKVVAVPSALFDHQRQGYLSLGFVDLIEKPVGKEQLCACLAEQLGAEFVFASSGPWENGEAVLPVGLHHDLLAAAESRNLSELRRLIGRLNQMEGPGRALGKRFEDLARQFDMRGVVELLNRTRSN